MSAQQKQLWSKIDEAKIENIQLKGKINIKKYQIFELGITDLKFNLKSAPRKDLILKNSNSIIKFPDENGRLVSFKIKESPVMHPSLAKQFPNNKSYIGVGLYDNSLKVRFSVNEQGLHAMIIGKDRKVQYIDPISKDNEYYKVYARNDLNFENNEFECFSKSYNAIKRSNLGVKVANDKKLRTYRLALASTGEYSQFHIDKAGMNGGTDMQKKAVVLASMTTAMTRVNALFENDLAIRMELVANNTNVIFLDSKTDPYTNDDIGAMLVQNQTTCDDVIGSTNYDIGHVFGTFGGGIASLAIVCNSSRKARGVTGTPNPSGDNFYFDFVAHEMGHQFGANHTFNGDAASCSGTNRNDDTAVEPGSGSTIMAYAGLCTPQNVQAHSDLYFQVISMDEIWTNITLGSSSSCGIDTDLIENLNVPTADAGNDFTIPISTAYLLKGQGNDADNDPISFSWEQIDNEITAVPPSETATAGALYRSVIPSVSSDRSMPDLNTLINGNISSKWEVTPSVSREMNFKLTVRDNNAEAGQIASDDLKVTVTDAAGPFIVTSQNVDNLVWDKNTKEDITWDVAGTTGFGVNTSQVNIFLSTDGGKTFPTVLESNTANDGTQSISVPDISASKCFVKVEAVGNFFYALNQKSFSIGEFNQICNNYDSADTPLSIPDNDPNGITSSITVSDNFEIEQVKVSVQITHPYVGDLIITLESPDGTRVELISNACSAGEDIDVVFEDNSNDLTCSGIPPVVTGMVKPTQQLSSIISENSTGNWKLIVEDTGDVDIGTLESWSLELCTSEPVLGVNSFVFEDFNVYPNPSNGIINIQFTSKNTSDVEITVFDLLGRKISQNVFLTNNIFFKESLNIGQISGGIYILQVKRGNETSSQKLQIR
jgi:subtilisin-like proprotein convertase family protein